MSDSKNPLKLSVSKTKTFLECQARYKYSYILKLPQKDNTFTIFGKFCHKVLEDFHLAYMEGSTENYNVTMSKAFKAALSEFKLTPDMKKECWDIINQYLKIVSDQKKEGIHTNVIACERRFEFNITDDIILNGAIDRIQIDDDGIIHVGDYKTVRNKKYLKDNELQLLTYAYYIMFNAYPDAQKVRCSYILLRHDYEYITYEFTREEVAKVKDLYIQYTQDILSETEWKTTVSGLCAYCPFLNLCEPGQKKANLYSGEVAW